MAEQAADRLIDQLSQAAEARDRTRYYELVRDSGDPYGELALGVVKQSLISGRVAKNFAVEVGRRCGIDVDASMWLSISEQLMIADLAARQTMTGDQFELPWITIRNYHVATFGTHHLPGQAWTAFIPLNVVGEDRAPSLWSRMCRSDMIRVGFETVTDLLRPVIERETGIVPEWAHVLPFSVMLTPPIAVGSAVLSMELNGCMKSVAALKACRERLTPTEEEALFWLDVLLTDIHGAVRDGFIVPTAIWRSL